MSANLPKANIYRVVAAIAPPITEGNLIIKAVRYLMFMNIIVFTNRKELTCKKTGNSSTQLY